VVKDFCVFLVVLATTLPAQSQELTIAAAADLRPALDEITAQFEAAAGIKARVSYGSSGNLYQQLQNGAPFDVFLSANVDYPKKLESAGLVLAGSYYEFARGGIVLLVRTDSKLDLHQGLHALLGPDVRKVAIADPRHAPYGQAAVAALRAEGLFDQISPKLVTGENISQAASFVLSGAADAGVVAMSLALTPSARTQIRFVKVPASEYPAIQQAMVILSGSKNQPAALKFETYMRAEDTARILQKYGFEVPEGGMRSSER
jgi:molybdate transport system substrate-binding protein